MRTLRRPMFRMGGSTNQGITSGLEKPKRGLVNEPGSYSQKLEDMKLSDISDYSIGDLRKISQSFRPRETYKDRDDFLINLGLDLVSRPPSSNIVSTVGAAARGPFKQFQASKAQKTQLQQQSEANLFSTLIGAQAKIRGGEGGGKGWLEQWKFNKIPILINEIDALTKKVNDGTATEQEILDLRAKETQFNRLDELDPFVKSYLDSEEGKYFWGTIKDELYLADQQSGEPKYTSKTDLQLELDAIEEGTRRLRRRKAEGGRIGYQNAGPVMPAAGDMGQATGDMGQETMPEELQQNLTFEELRNRLPQEIGDDIINLILSSAEAMEDFATIQTEQDISNFNKKYGVNLVLPSEG
jgi:hypothetical protein